MRASTVIIAVLTIFTTFGQELAASSIQDVRVLPTCAINPDDRVMLEVFLFSGTAPTYLYEPTQIAILDKQITIDLFAASGYLQATSSLMVPIDLGSHLTGEYSFTIRLHGIGWPDAYEHKGAFAVTRKRCPDSPRDPRHLYWADTGGIIKRSSLNGSKVEGLISGGIPSGFVMDAMTSEMYWITVDLNESTPATLEKANLDGSNRKVLLTMDPESWPFNLVKAGRDLFWFAESYPHSIWRCNLDGSDAHVIVNGLNAVGYGRGGLIVDEVEGKIYWAELFDKIRRANADGSEVETVVSGLDYPRLLALDSVASRLYWSTSTSGSVENGLYSSNLDGTGITPLITGQTVEPLSLLLGVLPGKMYWTNQYSNGALYRANLDGSEVEEIITHLPYYPSALTFDKRSGRLYWSTAGFLMSANLDGSDLKVITEVVDAAFGLSFDRSFQRLPIRSLD